MIDFLVEHAGFAVIVAFVLYALAIYRLVDVVKHATEGIEVLKRFRVAMAAAIGGITGPFAYPFLFTLLEVEIGIPIAFSIILGIGTGSVAVNIHSYVSTKLQRE